MRICLITPHHIVSQPRTLREADSLREAGYEVRVVCRQVDSILSDRDQRLMQTRMWRLQPVDLCRYGRHRGSWFIEGIRSKVSEMLFDFGLRTFPRAVRAYVRGLDRLVALAIVEPADWFIAHTQAALPVAAKAAERWDAKLGFDCEDLLAEAGTDPPAIVRLIEERYLPLCSYVSAPSQAIADYLARNYGVHSPLVLYNVFPLRLAEGLLPPRQRPMGATLRLHWFGQTLGPGRGLEEAIEAAGLIGHGVELHLRGKPVQGYELTLHTLALRHRVALKLHRQVPHDDLIKAIAEFDVGLALERTEHGNYSRTATNKLFAYLLAGLAVAATDTPGQREVMGQIPGAGFLYSAEHPEALADGLRPWQADRQALRAAQQTAWDVARERFCWDREKEKLFQVLR